MSYNLVKIQNLTFKLKGKKRSLTPKEKKAVDKMFDAQRVSKGKDCQVIFFGKKPVAVQRCLNRKTFKNKQSAFNKAAKARAKKMCRGKNERFKRC